VWMERSGAIGFIVNLVVPARLLRALNLMEWKISFRESATEQYEMALKRTFRAGDGAMNRLQCDCLSDIAATRTPQCDIEARVQSTFRKRQDAYGDRLGRGLISTVGNRGLQANALHGSC
jgi:hypothetical protein